MHGTLVPGPVRPRRRAAPLRLLAVVAVLAAAVGPLGAAPVAADGLTMEARVLLQGHARMGSWMAIAIDLANDGPAVSGEVRLPAPVQTAGARYAVEVDLPTDSRKTYLLFAQPPQFGRGLKLELVAGAQTVTTAEVAFVVHDTTQLVVGVVAEKPQGIIAALDLPASQSGAPSVVVPLGIADLPDRVEGWSGLDRLIWQDIDTNTLTPQQLSALRGWIAAGGRLVIVGGTAGLGVLSGLPDPMLPYRPTATVDAAPSLLDDLVGAPPTDAADVPALSGALRAGRALATMGESAIAAELAIGSGSVTLLGFDPTSGWIGQAKEIATMWRRFLPPRGGGGLTLIDDNGLINAVSQLPALALPPIGGLLLLLGGYIVLVGPLNYLILRRLDRREWAWITMPVIIVGFAVAAYAYGAVLKGTDLIVNEVAIVRGAPGTSDATAYVYLGVFSPTRGRYQVEVAGGALLASPINGEFFGGTATGLDVIQGDPARVRDLDVGVGALRTIRAETTTEGPILEVDLVLVDGVLTGHVVNASDRTLQSVAVVLGSSVGLLGDMAPGDRRDVRVPLRPSPWGDSLSNRVLGQVFYDGSGRVSQDSLRSQVRHAMIDQLTYDPTMGGTISGLNAENPVVLAFEDGGLLDVTVAGSTPRRTGNVLHYVPARMAVSGTTTFSAELVRLTLLDVDAQFFGKEPWSLSFGPGTATLAYRPIAFEGTYVASGLDFSLNWGPEFPTDSGKPVEPLADIPELCTDTTNSLPEGCEPRVNDGMPEVELFDRTGAGAWVRLPHLASGSVYSISEPARYTDPQTGQVLVRFVNPSPDGSVSFGFAVRMTGTIR